MQPGGQGLPSLEAYALAAAMAAAAASRDLRPGAVVPQSAAAGFLSLGVSQAAPQPPPRLGGTGGSAFAEYRPPPRPQFCAPPVHLPPDVAVSLANVAAPCRPLPGMPHRPAALMPVLPSLHAMTAAAAAAASRTSACATPQSTAAAATQGLVSATTSSSEPQSGDTAAAAPAAAPAVAATSDQQKASRTRYQEKNRRAQARFRERQKAKQSETGRRMAELEARLAELKVERDALAIRAQTLEQCLKQKRHAAGTAAPSSSGVGDGSGASSGGGSETANSSAGRISPNNGSAAAPGSPAASCASGGAGGSEADKPQREYPKNWLEFTQWYEGAIQRLAPLLAPAQAGGDAAALAAVEAVWTEVSDVVGACIKADEAMRLRMHTGPCVPGDAAGVAPPTPELWAKVTAALQLSESQVAHALRARRAFLADMRGLLQQRRALNDIIAASVHAPADTNPDVCVQHAKCVEVAALLQRNTQEQARLNTALGSEVWGRLMTPLQGATTCVGMYPFIPDKLAILTTVAMDAGEPDAAMLLAEDSPDAAEPPAVAAEPAAAVAHA